MKDQIIIFGKIEINTKEWKNQEELKSISQ